MRIVALFMWLWVPLCCWGLILVLGMPHVLIEHGWSNCTYLGWGPDWITVPLEGTSCWWIRFFE